MVSIVLLLAAFVLLTGIALLFVRLVRINLMEGLFLAVSFIIGILYLSGKVLHSFQPGQWLLILFGTAGCIWTLAGMVFKRQQQESGHSVAIFTPAYFMLILVLLYGAVAFYGVFLQHIDELHLWGPIVRVMCRQDSLPDWTFYGGLQMYGASFFQLFFLKLTGYREQTLYAASFLMTWIGFLLPVSFLEKRDWKKAVLYSLILYFSLYSLYRYNYKSIYVDLPCAAWAGGLASWWSIKRQRKKAVWSDKIILAAGLITMCFLKTFVGILMAVLVMLFLLFEKAGIRLDGEKKKIGKTGIRLEGERRFFVGLFLIGVLVIAAYGGVLLLLCRSGAVSIFPERIRMMMSAAEISLGKAVRTLGALANAFLGTAVSSHSRLEIYPFAFLLLLLVWLVIMGWIYRDDIVSRVRRCYVVAASMLYLMFLAAAFILLFSYEEAVLVTGVARYFSILLIYLFLIVLNLWIQEENPPKDSRLITFGSLVLLLFFVWGVNDRFISDATAYNEYQISGSEEIQETGREGKAIKKQISDSDRVFFINQGTENEYPQNVAFYYLEGQVSNYLAEPWRFTEEGCEIRIKESEYPTIRDLPALLADGGYTYLWVYDTDSYLADSLTAVFETNLSAGEMSDGQLFRIVYSDGAAAGLELAEQLNGDALTLDEEIELLPEGVAG